MFPPWFVDRHPKEFVRKWREWGRDVPRQAHTMIGLRRMDNIQYCVEQVLADNVPGDLIETGVYRGGATIWMRALLKAHGVTERQVWVADSFEGLPTPDLGKYPLGEGWANAEGKLACSLDQVKHNFEVYGLLDEQVHFLKGWFKDTLPNSSIEQVAVMRLDGDLYESTLDALTYLYPRLSPGGFAVFDDYPVVDPCRRAVNDYRNANGITEDIIDIDGMSVYWRRRH
jgi:hypothetical protein